MATRWAASVAVSEQIPALEERLAPLTAEVVGHPMYVELDSLPRVQAFMEYHVYAVWNFMSLLKALQRSLCCTTLPWVPQGKPEMRRLANEIVLEEESDKTNAGS